MAGALFIETHSLCLFPRGDRRVSELHVGVFFCFVGLKCACVCVG